MKATEENLDDSGFEEIPAEEKKATASDTPRGTNRPDISIVQPEVDKDGKTKYINVGGMWKNTSKNGREFYTIRIGNLKLLAFPNDRKE
jgi:hypothetical protein